MIHSRILGFITGKKSLLVFLTIICANCGLFAQGDLMVYPTRLVFDGKQDRIQIVNLHNTGKDSTTYSLSYIENRMHEDGHLEIIQTPDPGQKIASPYLRFYPRTITLAPGETQVVKVQLTKTNELEPGEYRSHLYFRPIPKAQELTKTQAEQTEEGISIKLEPIYGVSIANIVLIENPQSKISITDLAVEPGGEKKKTSLSMQFNRKGDASSYGDITVTYISPEGKHFKVAEKKGFAVYTPGQIRRERLYLEKMEGVDYQVGKLSVQYTTQGADKKIIAEKVLEL